MSFLAARHDDVIGAILFGGANAIHGARVIMANAILISIGPELRCEHKGRLRIATARERVVEKNDVQSQR
jgi:hypothetical protein